MSKKYWRAAAALLVFGAMTFAMAGCSGRAADIAQSVIGIDKLESKLAGKDSSDSSTKTESTDSKAEGTASKTESIDSKTESVDSKAESADSKTESVESKTESADSKTESVESKTESVDSKTESVESGAESKDESAESKDEPMEKVTITGEGLDLAYLLSLDNTHLTAGYAPQVRDELNRPAETMALQAQFGDEKCEFVHGEDKTIHLIFTAGYVNAATAPILDVLAEKGVKATFFFTGYAMEDNPDIIKRIINEGHTLGSHSYSHPTYGMDTYTVEQIIDDSMRAQKYIRDTYGYEMQYYNFPSGYFSQRALETVKAMGYKVIFYSFAYNDYDEENMISPDDAIAQLYAQLHVGEICQLHATSSSSMAVLASFIEGARELGYTFENYD